MSQTFYYCGNKGKAVTVDAKGTVTASFTESYPVGMPNAVKQLRACGFTKPRKAVAYDAWGRRIR